MSALMKMSGWIDRLNTAVGRTVYWLVLLVTIVSSGNALVRYSFNISSNAWLEIQWYLYSAIFLFSAGYTHLRNEHIRIDVITGRFDHRTQVWIDIIGGVVFLLPMAGLVIWLSIPMVMASIMGGEMSSDAGGLIRWPAKLLIPTGFALLFLQGVSETIKRIAFLTGHGPDPGQAAAHHPTIEATP